MNEEVVPYYAVHSDGLIAGFFGQFRWLSNFYPCPVGMGELTFPSTEHAYQAAKWPEHLRRQFIDVTAGHAKRLGKESPYFNERKWAKKKYDIMYQLNWSKYTKNYDLKKNLMLTEGYILEERNNWSDVYWGVNERGEGENNLGKILMNIREKLILQKNNNEW